MKRARRSTAPAAGTKIAVRLGPKGGLRKMTVAEAIKWLMDRELERRRREQAERESWI